MLISREESVLLVVDMQTKLLPAIAAGEAVKAAVSWLMRAAKQLGVPIIATEQYPQGLGPTDTELLGLLPEGEAAVAKTHFSCGAGQCFGGQGAPIQPQVVVCGIEAHVCVLQTCVELGASGRAVFVVEDAIGSRSEFDKRCAIERLRGLGVQVVSREMVAFEWLRRAGTEEFRAFSKDFLRG